MRWRVLWAIPLLIGLGVSCSDDVAEADLVGTWTATQFVFSDFGDPVTDFDLLAAGGDVEIVIRANNTYTITFDVPWADPEVDDGTWALAGSVLTFDEGTADETAFDVSLSGNILTIYTDDITFDFDENGTDDPAQLNARFERQ